MLGVGIVVEVLLVSRDVEAIGHALCEDGHAVVVGHHAARLGVGILRSAQFSCRHVLLAEDTLVAAVLDDADGGCGEVGLHEGCVIVERGQGIDLAGAGRLGFCGTLPPRHVRAVEQRLLLQGRRGLGVVVDNGLDIIRYGRQLDGKLTRTGVGLDVYGLHVALAVLLVADVGYALHAVGVGLLVIQRIGGSDEFTRDGVEADIHVAGVLHAAAGEQSQGGATHRGRAETQSQRLLLFDGTSDDTACDDGLRGVEEGQVADVLVEVERARGGIVSAVEERVAVLHDADDVVANGNLEAVFTLVVAHDGVVVDGSHLRAVDEEAAALDGIGGVLVIDEAAHRVLAVVGEVDVVERRLISRYGDMTADGVELVGILRGNDVVARADVVAAVGIRNALNGVVAVGVGQRE